MGLIDDELVRYDAREACGLQVLFNGIEAIHDLQSEIFNGSNFHYDIHEHLTTQNDEITKDEFLYETKFVRRSIESKKSNDKFVSDFEAQAIDQRSIVPQFMYLNPGMMSNVWGVRAIDLKHATLIRLWGEGFFENYEAEIQLTAYSMMKRVVTEELIEKVWDSDKNGPKAKKLKNKVKQIIKNNMPDWAKKYDLFIEALNEQQRKVIEAEYCYDDSEKPSQKVLAERLSMKEDNYKYHLKKAREVLKEIYPEFEPKPMRKSSEEKAKETEDKPKPLPLFQIINGQKIEVPHPQKKEKFLPKHQIFEIKKWSYIRTDGRSKNLHNVDDIQGEKLEEKLKRYFEKVEYEEVI